MEGQVGQDRLGMVIEGNKVRRRRRRRRRIARLIAFESRYPVIKIWSAKCMSVDDGSKTMTLNF